MLYYKNILHLFVFLLFFLSVWPSIMNHMFGPSFFFSQFPSFPLCMSCFEPSCVCLLSHSLSRTKSVTYSSFLLSFLSSQQFSLFIHHISPHYSHSYSVSSRASKSVLWLWSWLANCNLSDYNASQFYFLEMFFLFPPFFASSYVSVLSLSNVFISFRFLVICEEMFLISIYPKTT